MTSTKTKTKSKTKTDTAKLEKTFKKDAVPPTDEYTWFPSDYGDYRIETTRWGMYRSLDTDGQALVIGMNEQAVHTMTPIHMFAHSPEYDGSHDVSVRADQGFVEL